MLNQQVDFISSIIRGSGYLKNINGVNVSHFREGGK